MITALSVLAINAYSLLAGSGIAAARTGSVLVLTLIALWVLVVLSRTVNSWRLVIIGAMYAALVFLLTVPPLRDIFDFIVLRQDHLTVSVLVGLVGALAVEVLFRFHRRGLNADPALPHSGTR